VKIEGQGITINELNRTIKDMKSTLKYLLSTTYNLENITKHLQSENKKRDRQIANLTQWMLTLTEDVNELCAQVTRQNQLLEASG
jgi:uncharacterized protein YoxC